MRVRYLPAILLASLVSTQVSATPMTYEFTAVWNGAMGGSVPVLYDFGLPMGTAFTGTFTIEDQTASTYADGNIAIYDNPVTALTLNVGPSGSLGQHTLGQQFAADDSRSSTVAILDEYVLGGGPFDEFDVNFALSPAPGDDPAWRRTLQLNAFTGEGVPGSLFSGLPTLGDAFTRAQDPDFLSHFSLTYNVTTGSTVDDYRAANVTAQVTDLHLVSRGVPEPGTLSLFAAALLGMYWVHRRRTSHA